MLRETRKFVTLVSAFGALTLVAACSEHSGGGFEVTRVSSVSYRAPSDSDPASGYRSVPGASQIEAASGVANKLRAAGIAQTQVTRGGRQVVAMTRSPIALNCGTILVQSGGTTQTIPANEGMAAIPVAGTVGEFTRRNLDAETRYVVQVAPAGDGAGAFAAQVSGGHNVRLREYAMSGTQPTSDSRASFAYGSAAGLGGQTVCRSSDVIDRVIWD